MNVASMNKFEEIGKRIANARLTLGISQSELARRLKVTPQAVQKWEAGGVPRGRRAQMIAEVLNTTEEYLLLGTEELKRIDLPTIKKVPLIDWEQASTLNMDQLINFVEGCSFFQEWRPCPIECGIRSFCIPVQGESMKNPYAELSFREGDVIYVDPDKPFFNNSLVLAKLQGGNVLFRKLVIEKDVKILQTLNPQWYQPVHVMQPGDIILGVIFYQGREVL